MANDPTKQLAVLRRSTAILTLEKIGIVPKASQQARAAAMYLTAKGATEEARRVDAWRVNLERNAGLLLRGMRKAPAGRPSKIGKALLPIPTYKQLGIEKMDASRWQKLAKIKQDIFERFIDNAEEISVAGALRYVRQNNSRSTKTASMVEARVELRRGDFREVLSDIKEGSVSLLLTDPPYGKKYLDLWKDLGKFAAKVLSPTGILIAYSGQMYLAECLSSLSENLLYWWTGAIIHKSAGLSPLGHPVRKVINGWKPLLMYIRKDGEGFQQVFRDLVRGEGIEKEEHNWQQPVAEAAWIIEQFTSPGDLVVDPMAGSGTVGVACKDIGRDFIGAEVLSNG